MAWMGYYGIMRQGTGRCGLCWSWVEGPSHGSLPVFIQKVLPDLPGAVLGAEGPSCPRPQGVHSWVGHAGIQEVLICTEWSLLLWG